MFASVNGGGDLTLYDLNTSWHLPVAKKNLGKDAALSKVEWALEGKRLLVGSSTGQILSAAVAPDVGAQKLTQQEALHGARTLATLKTARTYQKILSSLSHNCHNDSTHARMTLGPNNSLNLQLVSIREGMSSNVFTLNVEQARAKAEAPTAGFTF